MKELTDRALNLASVRGASYADMRIVRRQRQIIVVKNGHVEVLSQSESQGFGVRVIANGAWGFASSSTLSAAEVDRVTALAVQIARASALTRTTPVVLAPAKPVAPSVSPAVITIPAPGRSILKSSSVPWRACPSPWLQINGKD